MNKKVISCGLGAIVVLSIFAMAIPVSAQPTASSFGVNDAMGNPNTYVNIPVSITDTQNGPIISVGFDILYNNSVINVVGVQRGDLTSNWDSPSYNNFDWGARVTIVYDGVIEHAIQNGSIGSVVLLNFSVIGTPGSTSKMNLSNIQLSDMGYNIGTAPAKNGIFRVDGGAPIVINPSANPDTINADGTEETQLNVTVRDDIAVRNVTIDLTPIGGKSVTYMSNIGNYTDENDVLWCIFNYTTNASIGTPPGIYHLQVNATDLLGNYNNTVSITLNVTSPETGSITGKITYSNNETGIEGVTVNLTKGGSVEYTTVTNETGYYNFTEVIPGSYYVNASKPRFWDNSTEVTVIEGATTTVDTIMLWLKGDLNNNGMSADPGDLAKMKDASVGKITPDWKYDLNNNGIFADPGDLAKMKDASVGKIVLM